MTSQPSMKCQKCQARAVIRMRQHRLALCKEHYIAWFIGQTEHAIKKYQMFGRDERILVAVSGGKDSLALWDVLWQCGYQADGMYINLGIEGEADYSNESERRARSFAEARGLTLHVVNIRETYGRSIPVLAQRSRRGVLRPCSVCGLSKRHVMNRIARELNYDVLATAHNLDDEVAVLMGNVMNWQTEQLTRQAPVLQAAEGFARKVKPFCRFYERDTAAYALLAGIDYIEEECPFSDDSKQLEWKGVLNRWEDEHPGRKFQFYINFLHARKSGLFTPPPAADPSEAERRCPNCGQPTTSPDLCAFCRLLLEEA
jgi:uncharacterized protein (TIGR00269 family)